MRRFSCLQRISKLTRWQSGSDSQITSTFPAPSKRSPALSPQIFATQKRSECAESKALPKRAYGTYGNPQRSKHRRALHGGQPCPRRRFKSCTNGVRRLVQPLRPGKTVGRGSFSGYSAAFPVSGSAKEKTGAGWREDSVEGISKAADSA